MAEKAARKPRQRQAHRPRLRVVPEQEGLTEILSGKVTRERPPKKKSRKRKTPTEALPGAIAPLADLFVAGRKVEKELEFKIRFAEQKVRDFCVRRFAEIFRTSGTRPPSVDYTGIRSHFSFVQTSKINLTLDKADTLRSMNIPIDDFTELKGVEINYEAIRRLRLESKLAPKIREALQNLGLSDAVLNEVLQPRVELRENFFNLLDRIVKESLGKGETHQDKLVDVLNVLAPASQIRNADLPSLDVGECFELIRKADITRLVSEFEESSDETQESQESNEPEIA